MILQLLRDAYKKLGQMLQARRDDKKLQATMTKLGWECTCPGCKKFMHTNSLVTAFRETEMHWHYTCKCGFQSAWHLYGPVSMYDSSYVEPQVNVAL